MGLLRRKASSYALHDQSRDWALGESAPEEVAVAYADFIVAEAADGTFGSSGIDHLVEWVRWCEQNLGSCVTCQGEWVLADGDEYWHCPGCGTSYTGD